MSNIDFIISLSSEESEKIKYMVNYLRSLQIDFAYVDSPSTIKLLRERNRLIEDRDIGEGCLYSLRENTARSQAKIDE